MKVPKNASGVSATSNFALSASWTWIDAIFSWSKGEPGARYMSTVTRKIRSTSRGT